jgi:hypothetical protein
MLEELPKAQLNKSYWLKNNIILVTLLSEHPTHKLSTSRET